MVNAWKYEYIGNAWHKHVRKALGENNYDAWCMDCISLCDVLSNNEIDSLRDIYDVIAQNVESGALYDGSNIKIR